MAAQIEKEYDKQRNKQFRVKEFRKRESLLTTLLEQTDLECLKNFFCAIFFLLFLKTVFEDTVNHLNPIHHMWLIKWNFEKLPITLLFWNLMAASTLVIYCILRLWSRAPCKAESLKDFVLLLSLYMLYICGLFYCCVRFIVSMQLHCACTFIITCESTRIVMKVHSFIREVYPLTVRLKICASKIEDLQNSLCARLLNQRLHNGRRTKPLEIQSELPTIFKRYMNNESLEEFPTFEQYIYFFFCPSLVFRQSYPRCSHCNWQAVKSYAQQIILIIYFVDLIFIQMIIPQFDTRNLSMVPVSTIISTIFVSIMPGALCLLLLFYGLLHCWLNMFAELLRYADRQFYMNWWSSKSMAEYYRYWNLVVHEWLYAYVYRDISRVIGGKEGLFVAQTMVFFLSSAFHEYWFGLALRMFYPVIFILYFIFGGIFYFISQFINSKVIWNIAMYANLLIGTGMFISFYGQEWYARQRCIPYLQSPTLDFLIPRHWFCTQLTDFRQPVHICYQSGMTTPVEDDGYYAVILPIDPVMLVCAVITMALVLALQMVAELYKLAIMVAKERKRRTAEMPILLSDLDTLGKNTIYRRTIGPSFWETGVNNEPQNASRLRPTTNLDGKSSRFFEKKCL